MYLYAHMIYYLGLTLRDTSIYIQSIYYIFDIIYIYNITLYIYILFFYLVAGASGGSATEIICPLLLLLLPL